MKPSETRTTAIHEAGHVVAYLDLGQQFQDVTIIPSLPEYYGTTSPVLGNRIDPRNSIIIALAGDWAETLADPDIHMGCSEWITNSPHWRSTEDARMIHRANWDGDDFASIVEPLVARHHVALMAITEALDQKTLSYADCLTIFTSTTARA